MSQHPRVGIVGYGLAGRYFHAPFLKAAGFQIAGVLTSNSERAASALGNHPGVAIVRTMKELLSLSLDLVVIASPNVVHAEQAIAAMRSGVPVVVDKPMGRDFAETKQMVDISMETGVPITAYFSRRWDSDALTVKKILREGILGNVFRLDSRFERFKVEANPNAWRESSSAADGGGNLLDLQPHLVSLALDWFGPAVVSYSSVRSVRGLSDDDVVIVLKHDSGVDSYLSASAIVGSPGPRIRVMGDQGALVINNLDKQEALLRDGIYPTQAGWKVDTSSVAKIHRGEEVIDYPSEPGNYLTFYEEVAKAIRGEALMPVSTNDALAVAEILDRAREISVR